MPRIAVVAEGDSEYFFVQKIIASHIDGIKPINIQGGRISVAAINRRVSKLIHNFDYVTTLVDYYGFADRDGKSIDELQAQMHAGVDSKLRDKFIPYVQQYEFEALVLSDLRAISDTLILAEKQSKALRAALAKHNNAPESVNHQTPPSKLLKQICPNYSKATKGTAIIQKIELSAIKSSCPRFSDWFDTIKGL